VDLLRPLHAFDRVQPAHTWLAIPVAVLKKFGDDQAGGLAALIAYYAFFSLFPLLLVFVTILGFVLHGNSGAQATVEHSVLGHFPVIGEDLEKKRLSGDAAAITLGILVGLWAGLGMTQAIQNSLNKIWAVPFKKRPDILRSRLRGLALVALLATVFLIATVASGLIAGGLGGVALKVAGIALSLLLNFVILAVAFRVLTAADLPLGEVWVGAAVGSVLWEILQALGGYYVDHVVRRATGTYGFFAVVIGVLAWLHLGAQATMYAAEVNVVLVRRLWPRSLFGSGLPGDESARRALAKIEERGEEEKIEVRFRE
jgi:YihY family inner membrane protein